MWFGCNIHFNLNQENFSSIQKWTSQVVESLKGKKLSQFLGKAVTVAWFIWKTRNEFFFNSDPIIPEKLLGELFKLSMNSQKLGSHLVSIWITLLLRTVILIGGLRIRDVISSIAMQQL